jgi:hypothetical protein
VGAAKIAITTQFAEDTQVPISEELQTILSKAPPEVLIFISVAVTG